MYGKESNTDVPIQNKVILTFPQAAKYTGIGENKLRKMAERTDSSGWILQNGSHKLIKRVRLEEMLLGEITI